MSVSQPTYLNLPLYPVQRSAPDYQSVLNFVMKVASDFNDAGIEIIDALDGRTSHIVAVPCGFQIHFWAADIPPFTGDGSDRYSHAIMAEWWAHAVRVDTAELNWEDGAFGGWMYPQICEAFLIDYILEAALCEELQAL